MKALFFFAAAAALGACGEASKPPIPEQSADTKAAPAADASPPATAFVQDVKDDLIDFHFAWPAEAAVVPKLVARFQAERKKKLSALEAGANEEREQRNREKLGLSVVGFQQSTDYATAGQSMRLLSLSVAVSAYTGGAHANFGTGSLLWDRLASARSTTSNFSPNPPIANGC